MRDTTPKIASFLGLIKPIYLLIFSLSVSIIYLETKLVVNSTEIFNPPRGDVRIVVISDLNSAYGATTYEPEIDKAINLIPFWQPDLVICAGDMIAGQSLKLTPAQIQAMWLAFDQHVTKPLADGGFSFAFTLGNHDASSAQNEQNQYTFAQDRAIASQYWQNSLDNQKLDFVDSHHFPFYYTFEHQGIFFLVWDASSALIPPQQLAWVEESLASSVAQTAKMRLVIGHLPLYGVSEGRDRPGEVLANSETLQSLLEQYNVHTYISGHHHAYYPAYKGNLQLLNAGVLGQGARSLIAGDFPPSHTLTIVDINFDSQELTTYTTYNMKTLELINNSQLPPYLNSHNGKIWRRD